MPKKDRPTYEELAAENDALRTRAEQAEAGKAAADADAQAAKGERDAARKAARRRALDPKSPSAFGRPYDGR